MIASEAALLWSCRNHPDLVTKVYGTPVMDLAGRHENAERYRDEGGPLSLFDRSTKSTPFTRELLKAPEMTHKYANHAKNVPD